MGLVSVTSACVPSTKEVLLSVSSVSGEAPPACTAGRMLLWVCDCLCAGSQLWWGSGNRSVKSDPQGGRQGGEGGGGDTKSKVDSLPQRHAIGTCRPGPCPPAPPEGSRAPGRSRHAGSAPAWRDRAHQHKAAEAGDRTKRGGRIPPPRCVQRTHTAERAANFLLLFPFF